MRRFSVLRGARRSWSRRLACAPDPPAAGCHHQRRHHAHRTRRNRYCPPPSVGERLASAAREASGCHHLNSGAEAGLDRRADVHLLRLAPYRTESSISSGKSAAASAGSTTALAEAALDLRLAAGNLLDVEAETLPVSHPGAGEVAVRSALVGLFQHLAGHLEALGSGLGSIDRQAQKSPAIDSEEPAGKGCWWAILGSNQ